METYNRPFLTNETLRSASVIELGDIALAAQELLAAQQAMGGQLVVDPKLRLHLAQGYYKHIRENGMPPDAIKQPNYPEYWFVPLEWQVFRRMPGELSGEMKPIGQNIVLFFAVRKRF